MFDLLLRVGVYLSRLVRRRRPLPPLGGHVHLADDILRELTAEEVAEAYQLCAELERVLADASLTGVAFERETDRIGKRLGEIAALGRARQRR